MSGEQATIPRGPLSQVYRDELSKLDKYHFELNLSTGVAMGRETKMAIELGFLGDLPAKSYQIVLGYRYSPPIGSVLMPHRFNAGIAIKKYWGDYQISLFTEMAQLDDIEAIKNNWRLGVMARVNYDLYSFAGFRFGFMGEAGFSTGNPAPIASHLTFGMMIGFGR